MKKILIIQTRIGIGDMCVFLPCIHEICKKYQNYKIHLLTKKRTSSKEFLREDQYIKKIIYLPENTRLKINLFIFNLLKKNNYQKCFIMHYGLRYFLLSKIAGIKDIFFYGLFKKKESIVKKSRQSVSNWIEEKNLKFKPGFLLNLKVKKKMQIIFGIGGSGFDKKWKIENYVKLAELIIKKNKDLNFVIAGGKNEKKDSFLLISSIKKKGVKKVINLCNMKISKSLKFLKESKMYIGNDTGFMHLAGMLNVPTFGLFGSTPPDYSSYNKIIFPIKPKGVVDVTYGDFNMERIKPKYVYKILKKKKYVN